MLDPIHNQGLRLALGAFRTSPVASLYVEADKRSLYSRREKLSLQYAIRLAANPSNAGPGSAVGNVSGYRCVSDCRSRGHEFDPGPVPYFRGD